MLQRATSGLYSPSRWTPGRWSNWRRGLVAGPTSVLLRYVAIAALLTAVGCLYLWQTNSLRQIQVATAALRSERAELEQANVNLVNQLALWNTPAYVEARSKAAGYVTTQSQLVISDPAIEPQLAQGVPTGVR